MKLKKVNKRFNQVSFIVTINYDLLINFYHRYPKKLIYPSVNYSYKHEKGYKIIYKLYKNLNIGFFKNLFIDFRII